MQVSMSAEKPSPPPPVTPLAPQPHPASVRPAPSPASAADPAKASTVSFGLMMVGLGIQTFLLLGAVLVMCFLANEKLQLIVNELKTANQQLTKATTGIGELKEQLRLVPTNTATVPALDTQVKAIVATQVKITDAQNAATTQLTKIAEQTAGLNPANTVPGPQVPTMLDKFETLSNEVRRQGTIQQQLVSDVKVVDGLVREQKAQVGVIFSKLPR